MSSATLPEPPCAAKFTGRVAHCMVGVADHGNRKDRFPIYEARTYNQVAAWLARLRRYGGTHDLFLSLDLRIWPKRNDPTAQARFAADASGAHRVDNATLSPMLAALRPAGFVPFEAPPRCSGSSACLCKAAAYPGWWEQMSKNDACFQQVRLHSSPNPTATPHPSRTGTAEATRLVPAPRKRAGTARPVSPPPAAPLTRPSPLTCISTQRHALLCFQACRQCTLGAHSRH
jgi:hypothetical protein